MVSVDVLIIIGMLAVPAILASSYKASIRSGTMISIYGVNAGGLDQMNWSSFDYVVWQNLCVNSDASLYVQDNEPVSNLTSTISKGHANGVPVLICIFGTSNLSQLISDVVLRSALIENIKNWVYVYNADGVNIDCEGSVNPVEYAQFLTELKQAMPSKLVTAIAVYTGININVSAEPYVDFLLVMAYDYPEIPSAGSVQTVSDTMQMWVNAGWPKKKLDLGISMFATTDIGTIGWTPFFQVADQYTVAFNMSQAGPYYFNSGSIINSKVQLAKSNYGGVWSYEVYTDAQGNMSRQSCIDEALK